MSILDGQIIADALSYAVAVGNLIATFRRKIGKGCGGARIGRKAESCKAEKNRR
jgi:hypothetical protein